VPNKWWEAKVLPLEVPTLCKCKDFGRDTVEGHLWRWHFPEFCPVGYEGSWWDDQERRSNLVVPLPVRSFYIASESDQHVGCHDESLYMVMLMFISTVEITANDTIMLICQVNSGGVITSDVVLSAVTTESAIEIKLMEQPSGVGTTLF
jgi:hypothetical protein